MMVNIARCSIKVLIVAVTLASSGLHALAQDCTDQAKEDRSAVVSLTVKKIKKSTGQVIAGSGTGFIVSPQGYVLTADHVIERDATIDEVQIDGAVGSLYATKSPMRIVEEEKGADVAMLQFRDGSHAYVPIRLGNPFNVQSGAQMCSLSYSAPINADYHITTGSLSSLSGEDVANGVNNLWTTQLPSNEGESGAPVVQLPEGGVVAIKYGGERPGVAQNVNYIIPINLATRLLQTFTGNSVPRGSQTASASEKLTHLEKIQNNPSVIPVGAWSNFSVRVVDPLGKPVPGTKIAWQTPSGGALTYVGETNADGIASATNLYTFPTPGNYLQTAKVVSKDTPIGFTQADKVVVTGADTTFAFQEK